MRTRIKEVVLSLGYIAFKIIRTPIKWYWKKFNIKTNGVRVMIIHKGSIVLVRHWYNTLWVMPGGGIKKYETPEQAAIREVKEEIGLNIEQLDYKLGVYSNIREGKNDTIHCFVIELEQKPLLNKKFNFEVSDVIWSVFDDVPSGTSNATKQRISEYLHQDIKLETRPWSE